MAPEDWWKLMGIVFLQDEEQLRTPATHKDDGGNTLFFVSERRLGFGTHPASNIAQRFSDALLGMFREDMDKADAPFLAADTSPAYLKWRERRREYQTLRRAERRHRQSAPLLRAHVH
eukprot:4631237-Pleurochrysis_carterae.AAC.1